MSYDTDEQVKVQKGSKGLGNGEDVTYTHPSYGMARFSRISGQFKEMFGSEVENTSAVTLTVGKAQVTQDFGDNWYYMYNTVCEVQFSPIQYAELISNP